LSHSGVTSDIYEIRVVLLSHAGVTNGHIWDQSRTFITRWCYKRTYMRSESYFYHTLVLHPLQLWNFTEDRWCVTLIIIMDCCSPELIGTVLRIVRQTDKDLICFIINIMLMPTDVSHVWSVFNMWLM